MPYALVSPYPDDLTRQEDVPKLIEEWIKARWDETATGVLKDDVAFGVFGSDILQSGKQITLRVYSFFTSRDSEVYGRRRWKFLDSMKIDVYVLNNDRDDQRDPRAISIMKWLEELAVTFEGDMPNGIYEMKMRSSDLRSDPFNIRLTHAVVPVDVIYLADLIEF